MGRVVLDLIFLVIKKFTYRSVLAFLRADGPAKLLAPCTHPD